MKDAVPSGYDRLLFVPAHPVYGDVQQTVWFDRPVEADALRVEILEPAAGRPWCLSEIDIGYDAGTTPEGS